jgi:transglutaminase-like putative cysteine protease
MQETIILTNGFARTTGDYMRQMVDRYHLDMAPYASLSLIEIFDLIKSIPYRPDPIDAEVLMRPYFTMNMLGYGGDCDDKTIALASYCRLVGITYRFMAVRSEGEKMLHHVFLQCYIRDKWITFDPTYSFNRFGRERKKYAEYVVI